MKRKLLLLNALLAGLLILGAAELYRQTLDAGSRYDRLQAFSDPRQPPEFPAAADPQAVRAADFLPVVDRLLFSQDRNADILVETVAPEVARRPPLPQLSGLIDFGDGPSALMTARLGEPATWVSAGGEVGDFTFEGVEGDQVTLSWNGESFTVSRDELGEAAPAPAQRAARTRRPPNQRQRGQQPRAGAAPANLAGTAQDARIGAEIGEGRYAVVPGDDSPEGTEHNGFVKKSRSTPFGKSYWWEKNEQ